MKRINIFSVLCAILMGMATVSYSQTIDLSKPVGTPDGGGGVGAGGTSTYSVPIKVLPGIGNMTPNISIEYSSSNRDGVAGYGWHLSCMSSIKRVGMSNYYNNVNTPVKYTNTNDAFELDGQRMFVTSGTNGLNGVYGLENEQFSKIESFGGSETSGPDWFKVTLKNGTVMEYGNGSATKMPTDDGNSSMIWFLNKVYDGNGNYEIFSYYISSSSDRVFALNDITYGGNSVTGTPYTCRVHFTYSVKNDWVNTVKYDGGASIRYPYYLTNISVLDGIGAQVKSYDFTYTILRDKYLLQSITEKGSDGTALNPITFSYGSNTSANDVTVSANRYPLSVGGSYAADFTGDGKSDVMSVKYSIDNNGVRHDVSYNIYTDFGSYGGEPALSPIAYSVTSSAGQVNNSTDTYRDYLTNDFDGDGKEDVAIMNASASGSDLVFSNLQINYSRKYNAVSAFTSQNVVYSQMPSVNNVNYKYVYRNGTSFGKYFIQGDFNGDGVQDYILVLGANSSNQFKAFFSSPRLGIFNQEILNFGVSGVSAPYYANSIANATQLIPLDFDGDGKQEILVVTATQSYILSVSATYSNPVGGSTVSFGSYVYSASTLYSTTAILGQYPVYPGDFNGDGKTDLLYRASYNSATANWYILTSTGTSYNQSSFAWANRPYLPQDGGGSSHAICVADYDHDGKTDVWQSLDQSSTTNKHNLEYYHGTTFHLESYSTSGSSINGAQVSSSYGYPNAVVGDYNGDGKADLLSINSASSGIFIYPKPLKEDLFLVSATNGLGRKEQFSYGLLTNSNALSPSGDQFYSRSWYYDYDQASQYGVAPSISTEGSLGVNGNPFNGLMIPLYAVNTYAASDGNGGTKSTYYSYVDATYSRLRGFLGFGTVNAMDGATGITSGTQNKFNAALLLPHVWHRYTYLYPDTLTDTKLTDTLLAVGAASLPSSIYKDRRFVTQILSTLSYDNIKGTASKTDNTYDSYGNITTSVSKNGYLNGTTVTAAETVTTTTSFGIHGTPVPAMPDSRTESRTRNGQAALSVTTAYTYDTKGNIATKVDYSGQPKALTNTFTRDGFGNVTQSVISGSGVSARTTKFTYDNTGRFPTQKEVVGSGISKKTILTYESTFGNVASVRSPDGLTTSFTYDVFGRLKTVVKPEGYTITQTFGWESVYGRFFVNTTRPGGGSNIKTYYDLLNREVRKEVSGFNDALLVSSMAYNAKGQVTSSVRPHYTSEAATTTTYQYDSKGRPVLSTNGTVTASYAYEKLSGGLYRVTETNGASQSKSRTTDGAGAVVSATDNGGTVAYTYNSLNLLTQSAVNGTAALTSVYDIYGNRTSVTERNSGSTTSQYDAFGQVTNTTDALSHTTTLTYDLFGRMVSRVGAEGTTSITYWSDASNGYSNDNPSSVTGFGGEVKEYTYDNLRRVTQEKVTVDGTAFATAYAYDTYGNPTLVTYPSGVAITHVYDHNSIETQTKMGSTNLFSATAMNNLGKYTAYSTGNGKSTTESYNLVTGTPTQFLTNDIQNLSFSFDAQTGNLTQRKDVLASLQEDFTYDNLDRLLTVKVNNVQTQSLSYDGSNGNSLGNISSKTDAGSYTYSSSKVNAVAYITNPAGATAPPSTIPTSQQDITYTAFQKTLKITDNNNEIEYTYGSDYQRIKSVLKNSGNLVETKYYLGGMERQQKFNPGAIRDIHYIHAGNSLCAIIVKEGSSTTVYYTYTDYLGSILKVTNSSGTVVATQSFDAWGRKRNPSNGTYTGLPTTNPDWLYRGYTGHEHLDAFTLVNMNGRMYDPVQGRMMSADLFINDAGSTQGYNMYSYVNNNPLKFVDPSGYLVDDDKKHDLEPVIVTGGGGGDGGGGNYYWSPYIPDYFVGTGSFGGGNYGDGGPGGGGPGGGGGGSSSPYNNVTVTHYVSKKNNSPYTNPYAINIQMSTFLQLLLQSSKGDFYADEVIVSTTPHYKDMSRRFNHDVNETRHLFHMLKTAFDRKSWIRKISLPSKLLIFAYLVRTNGKYDLKNNGYSEVKIGTWSKWDGNMMRFDDYGNYNYGVAAKEFGISLEMALFGAGMNQVSKGEAQWSNADGWYDYPRDTEMIKKGYNSEW